MASIQGLHSQILSNFNHLPFGTTSSKVDILVKKTREGFYKATITGKLSGIDLVTVNRGANSVERALEMLLEYTCEELGKKEERERDAYEHPDLPSYESLGRGE